MHLLYLALLFIVLAFGGTSIQRLAQFIDEFELPQSQYGLLSASYVPGTLLFTGDIMLGRSVEDVMTENGDAFPFTTIARIVGDHDRAVANFEASVPEVHVKTKSNTVRFSVKETALAEVARTGFDILSLSNNHALDFGESGFDETKEACRRLQVSCVGHPTRYDEQSSIVTEVGDTRVGILMLHTVFGSLSTSTAATLLSKLEENSDVQYAFIHWGTEYERLHSREQEVLARFLIDEGVDGVIGHHPHVMQDVELYQGKPIFYSLGNLIFDQHFSRDVQEGYMVSVTFDKKSIVYTLIPYDTHDVRLQPKIQTDNSRSGTLQSLLRYPVFTETEIHEGSFKVMKDY